MAVDLPSYLRGLAASDDQCHYVIAELEELAHRLERELGFAGYRSPCWRASAPAARSRMRRSRSRPRRP